ncbi:ribosomal protein S18-alanine N-acetyltransferase [Archaeoglobus neptunius]|uniref:ribosomal protein S18-alanine N-acetyltransferase n=1 Tax=Archaeoglobus neptunius TaxID=2798580 RepID=UPI002EDBB7B3
MQSIIIRDYSTRDFKEILEIDKEAFSPRNPAYDVYVYLTYGSDLLVADLGNKIAGYIVTMDVDETTGKIIAFAVRKEFRRMGIGKILLGSAIKRLEGRGKKKIILEVRVSNIPAQELYKKFGFKVAEIIPGYYSDGEDAYLMIRTFQEQ